LACLREVLGTYLAALSKQDPASMTLGCKAQFELGNFRYDDRLRARRYPLVDVERGAGACQRIHRSG